MPCVVIWYWKNINDVITLASHAVMLNDDNTLSDLQEIENGEQFRCFMSSPEGLEITQDSLECLTPKDNIKT